MSDIGLLSTKVSMSLQALAFSETNMFSGAFTENYIACALASNGYDLMYWESKGAAEVDFLIIKEDHVIPIEVKASQNTKAKSLMLYVKKYSPLYSIRISAKNFGFENNIKSVPFMRSFLYEK